MSETPPHDLYVYVVGPFSAGKTAFVQAACDPVTEAAPKNLILHKGQAQVNHQLRLNFQEVPGTRRFGPWVADEICQPKASLGFVVVVDCTKSETFDEALFILRVFRECPPLHPYVVVINHRHNRENICHEAWLRLLAEDYLPPELLHYDIRNQHNAYQVLAALFQVACAGTPSAEVSAAEHEALRLWVETKLRATQQHTLYVGVAGPSLVGRMAFIKAVSDPPNPQNVRLNSGQADLNPDLRLIFFDLGGVKRFHPVLFAETIKQRVLLGLVLVLDCTDLPSFPEVANFYASLREHFFAPNVVVAHHSNEQLAETCHIGELNLHRLQAEMLHCDLTLPANIYRVLAGLLQLARVNTPYAAVSTAEHAALAHWLATKQRTVPPPFPAPPHDLFIQVIGPFSGGKTTFTHAACPDVENYIGKYINPVVIMAYARAQITAHLRLLLLDWFGNFGFKPDCIAEEIAQKTLLGLVLVIDCTKSETFAQATHYFDMLHAQPHLRPYIIIANHHEHPECKCHVEWLNTLAYEHLQTNVLHYDLTNPQNAYRVLAALFQAARAGTPSADVSAEEHEAMQRWVEGKIREYDQPPGAP